MIAIPAFGPESRNVDTGAVVRDLAGRGKMAKVVNPETSCRCVGGCLRDSGGGGEGILRGWGIDDPPSPGTQ